MPRNHGLDVVAVGIIVCSVADLDAYKLEPGRLRRRRGDIDLRTVETDVEGALFGWDAECLGLLLAHPGEGVEQPAGVSSRAGTAAGVGVAGCLLALFRVVRRVDRDVAVDGDLCEQIADIVHRPVVVLLDGVKFDEGDPGRQGRFSGP